MELGGQEYGVGTWREGILGKANSKSKKIKGEKMEASGSPFVWWERMKAKTGWWLRA